MSTPRWTFQGASVLAVLGALAAACGGASPPAETPPSAANEESAGQASAPGESDPAPVPQATPDPGGPAVASVDDPPAPSRTSPARMPTDARPMDGPYESLEAYASGHAPDHDPSCGPLPKPSTSPVRLGGRGAIRDARHLRAPDSIACASVEYCLLALRTNQGWFVSRSERPCHGVVGPGREARLDKVRGRWVTDGALTVLALEETRQRSSGEVSEVAGVKSEQTVEHESRYVTFCGVGPSGVPSCMDPLVASCPNSDGSLSEVSWTIAEGTLHLESTATSDGACDMDGPFVVGDYPLRFE